MPGELAGVRCREGERAAADADADTGLSLTGTSAQRRIEADLDSLSDTNKAQIQQAVTATRATRQTVMLGMPAIPAARDG